AVNGTCAQVGIDVSTPTNRFFGPEQTPPRYIQELLHPYVKNIQLWFCLSVGKDRRYRGNRSLPTYGYNGTTYMWHYIADPSVTGGAGAVPGRLVDRQWLEGFFPVARWVATSSTRRIDVQVATTLHRTPTLG